jgi:hypothetical protein
MELCALRSGYNYRQAIIKKIALIARRARGIGRGLHPESDFEKTSKLFILRREYIFADEFIRERNGSKVNPMANYSPNVNRTRL